MASSTTATSDSPRFRVVRDGNGLKLAVEHRLSHTEIAALLYESAASREDLADDVDVVALVAAALGASADALLWHVRQVVTEDQHNNFAAPWFPFGSADEFRERYAFCAARAFQVVQPDVVQQGSALIG